MRYCDSCGIEYYGKELYCKECGKVLEYGFDEEIEWESYEDE